MKNQLKSYLVVLSLIGLFLYTYRLDKTLIFSSDFARDTYRVLEMWQSKTITLLGPPMSFGQYSHNEIFHTSLSLYVGMLGSLVSGFSPLGPVIPNTILFTLSIPIFYLLVKRLTDDARKQWFITILYVVSPITVSYARFFWVPNLIIPLATFYWYLFFRYKPSLLLGILAGVMFNFHYMALLALPVSLYLMIKDKKSSGIGKYILGFCLTLLPLLAFELRNHFYLTSSLLSHLMSGNAVTGAAEEPNFFLRLTLLFSSMIGARFAELNFSSPVFTRPWHIITSAAIFLRYLFKLGEWRSDIKLRGMALVSIAIILASAMGGTSIHVRYLFCIYPLLVYLLGDMLFFSKKMVISYSLLLLVAVMGMTRITWTQNQTEFTFPLASLERIGQTIVTDNFSGNYNVTENITGDAQATAIRYFVQRDALKKPQSKLDYANLDALYAVASSLEAIKDAARWEYTATPNLVVEQKWHIVDGVELFKLVKKQ